MTEGIKRIIFRCPDEVFQRMAVEAKRQGIDWTSFILRAITHAVDLSEYERTHPREYEDKALAKHLRTLEKQR